jgi:hypothetical protein
MSRGERPATGRQEVEGGIYYWRKKKSSKFLGVPEDTYTRKETGM